MAALDMRVPGAHRAGSRHCGEGDTDVQTFTNRFGEAVLSLRDHGHC